MKKNCSNCGASVEKNETVCPFCENSFLTTKLEIKKNKESSFLLFLKKFKFFFVGVLLIMIVLAIGIQVVMNKNSLEKQINSYYQAISEGDATYLAQNTVSKDGKKITKKELIPFIEYFKEKPNQLKKLQKDTKKKNRAFGNFIVNGTKFIVAPNYDFEMKTSTIDAKTNQKNISFYLDGKNIGKTSKNNEIIHLGTYLPGKYEGESIFEYDGKKYKNTFIINIMDGENYTLTTSYELFAATISANISEGDIFIDDKKVAELKDGRALVDPIIIEATDKTKIVVKGSINGQDFSLPIEEVDISKYTVHLDDKNYQTLDIILPIIDFEVVSNIEGGDLVMNGNKIGTIEDGKAQLTRILLSTDAQVIEVNKKFSNRSLNEKAKISKEDNQGTIEINSSDIFGKEQILEQLNQIGQSMPLRIDEKFLTGDKTSDLQEKIASEMSAVHTDFEKKTSFDVNLTNCEFSIQEIEQTDSDSYLVKATYRINSTTSWSQKGAFGLVSTTNTNDNEPVDGKYTTWVLKNEEGILKVSDIQ